MQIRNDYKKKPYFIRVLIGIDQLLNAMLGGNPDHTISGRIGWRIATNKATAPEKALCWFLRLFENKHCLKSVELDEIREEIMDNKNSNAILDYDELQEHFSDESNHYLYKKLDDGSLRCTMCCSFEIVNGSELIANGECGDGIIFNPATKEITIQRKDEK